MFKLEGGCNTGSSKKNKNNNDATFVQIQGGCVALRNIRTLLIMSIVYMCMEHIPFLHLLKLLEVQNNLGSDCKVVKDSKAKGMNLSLDSNEDKRI